METAPESPRPDLEERLRQIRAGKGKRATAARAQHTRQASRWVLAIALLLLIQGTLIGFQTKAQNDRSLVELADRADTDEFDIQGKRVTTVELRVALERARLQAFVVPIGIGLAFVGLWAWSRKSPLPALATALALYVTVNTVAAVIEPKSLTSGIVVKVLCIAGLGRGIKSALEERAIQQADSPSA